MTKKTNFILPRNINQFSEEQQEFFIDAVKRLAEAFCPTANLVIGPAASALYLRFVSDGLHELSSRYDECQNLSFYLKGDLMMLHLGLPGFDFGFVVVYYANLKNFKHIGKVVGQVELVIQELQEELLQRIDFYVARATGKWHTLEEIAEDGLSHYYYSLKNSSRLFMEAFGLSARERESQIEDRAAEFVEEDFPERYQEIIAEMKEKRKAEREAAKEELAEKRQEGEP